MFSKAALLATLLLALNVAATPIEIRDSRVTLPIARQWGKDGVVNLVRHDRARAAFLRDRANGVHRRDDVEATNSVVSYLVAVGVGSPATTYNLIVDTGSSNTWVGAGTAYVKTSTSTDTGEAVSVSYGSGSFSGEEYTDTVTLGDLVINQQSIGVASSSQGFSGEDGILGIGPVDLTQGTLTNDEFETIPTVTSNLYSAGTISSAVVAVYFQPSTDPSETNGELTFGEPDPSKYDGKIAYTPITTQPISSSYWGIDQSIAYGSTTILSETAGIVDTGTTLVMIASDAFSKYEKATGGTSDQATGLLKITSTQYDKLENLNFKVGSATYSLTPNAQIFPRSLNTYIGGESDGIYLIVSDIGQTGGEGLDFINGYAFLERFYSVFDTTNNQVGFARTAYTKAETN